MMNYLSVCSGIEAATQAWHPLGWKPVAFSEIEKFPSAVLAHHYPNVPNWGDMTKFKDWPDANVDVLVGGTPCQDYSIAGKRLGMAGDRGQLTLAYIEIAARYRPNWIVFENVPGLLSSNRGRDFARFLGDLSGKRIAPPKGGWGNSGIISGIGAAYGLAYRVLDAQYVRTRRYPWAVPQRRRRVFVIGCLGDWRRSAAVLFDHESLSGNTPPRRQAGQGFAAFSEGSIGSYRQDVVAATARASGGSLGGSGGSETLVSASRMVAFGEYVDDGTGSALKARDYKDATDLVAAFKGGQGSKARGIAYHEKVAPTLGATQSGSNLAPSLLQGSTVRRLTPRECERLQGFPDDFTAIPWRGKPAENCPDGPRYKALGNSMAVNVMDWIGQRIQKVEVRV